MFASGFHMVCAGIVASACITYMLHETFRAIETWYQEW